MMHERYFYRCDEIESGPVTFEELVRLARSQEVHPATSVRQDGHSDLFEAGDIPSLFHMAGRADDVSKWRADQRVEKTPAPVIKTSAIVDQEISQPESDSDEDRTVGSNREIKEAAYRAALYLHERHGKEEPPVATEKNSRVLGTFSRIVSSVRHGVVAVVTFPFDLILGLIQRSQIHLSIPQPVRAVLARIFAPHVFVGLFRWVATLGVPYLIYQGVHAWSRIEAQRYPEYGETPKMVWALPVWGQCGTSFEYYFVLINLMIVTAVITFICFRWVESHAEG